MHYRARGSSRFREVLAVEGFAFRWLGTFALVTCQAVPVQSREQAQKLCVQRSKILSMRTLHRLGFNKLSEKKPARFGPKLPLCVRPCFLIPEGNNLGKNLPKFFPGSS